MSAFAKRQYVRCGDSGEENEQQGGGEGGESSPTYYMPTGFGVTPGALAVAAFPPYPGFPTAAMRERLAKWDLERPTKDGVDREEFVLRLWREECENAHAAGMLQAVADRARRDLIGCTSKGTESTEYSDDDEDEDEYETDDD